MRIHKHRKREITDMQNVTMSHRINTIQLRLKDIMVQNGITDDANKTKKL